MSFDVKRGVHVAGGAGVVAHLNGLTAFATGDEAELNTLVVRLNALAEESWTEVIRALTSEITALGYDAHPNIACVSVESDKVMAFVFGEATLSLTIDGEERILNGRDSSTWIDVTLHGELSRVMSGTQSGSPVVGVLRDGVTPGGGFMLDAEGPMPASSRWHEHMPQNIAALEASEAVTTPVDATESALVDEVATAEHAHTIAEAPAPLPVDAMPATPESELAESEVAEPEAAEPVIEAAEASTPANSEHEMAAPIAMAVDDSPAADVEPAPMASVAATNGVAAGAAGLAAAGLFARLDERMPADEIAEQDADEAAVDEPAVDEPTESQTASVFDDPEALDGGHLDPSMDPIDDPIAPVSQTAAPEVEPSAPAEPSPIASLTQTRPQIRGVRCGTCGSLTKPDGSPCTTCGARIEPDAKEEAGDRPALGKLTFDDGAELSIERPAAIGSDVPSGYTIDGEPATIVRLDDGTDGIDGVHLEIRLSGWNVNVADMSSNGGTYTVQDDERQTRTKLRSGQTVALQSGMTVEAGRRSFTYTLGPTPPAI